MKKFLILILSLCLALPHSAYGAIQAKEEGVSQGYIQKLNFVGDAVTLAVAGIEGTVTVTAGGSVSDTAYDEGTWDGVTTIAPSKNAVRDKIEALPGGHNAVVITLPDANVTDSQAITFADTGIVTITESAANVITFDATEVDGSTTNEIQDLSLTGNTLSLSEDATTVDLSGYLDNTDTQLTEEEVEDYVGGMVTGNTETLIAVTYEDIDGTLDFVVDNNLANYSNATSGFLTAETDPNALLTGGTNNVNDTHIDWGVGATQVSAVDLPIADAGTIITATEVEGALQENRTAINLNTNKVTNVSTALSAGTVNATTYGITSDGGADDIVLPEADTTNAGLLGSDKWNEIVANTNKTTNATHTGDATGSGA